MSETMYTLPLAELREALYSLQECSEELEHWVRNYYTPEARKYPSEERRFQRDIEPAKRANAILAKLNVKLGD